MAFSITDFRARFKDGARPNLFEVEVQSPAGIAVGGVPPSAPFMVKAAQLPSSIVGSIEVPYFGRKVKVVGDRVVEDWTLSVINDEDFSVRKFFENWVNLARSIDGAPDAGGAATPGGSMLYVADFRVKQFGRKGDVIARYKMRNIFPVAVSPIDLNWEANDAYEEFQVTLRLDFWERE